MACFYPLAATQLLGGKILIHKRTPGVHQHKTPAHLGRDMKLPCGRCTGCKLDRSKEWSIRLMHEAQLHEKTSFLTLTYNTKSLYSGSARSATSPPAVPDQETPLLTQHELERRRTQDQELLVASSSSPNGLTKRHLQLFMKRLREDVGRRGSGEQRIKFYACGEYGEKLGRPHYHIALFGEDFSDDRYKWRTSGTNTIWRSSRLEKLWPMGHSEIGELTIESAAYVAAYVTKKINGPMADEHYKRVNPMTGETYWLTPEFSLMSRGGRTGKGIAHAWFEEFQTDVYPHDHVIHKNKKKRPPRYYDKLLNDKDPAQMAVVKLQREIRAMEGNEDNTPARLADKEAVLAAKQKLKIRNLK
ncbi:replication initiator protein [Blackfly microvirus SF02]|uniref:Replication initiator protein n=1 Tax=Blackfly microvirus SF02 TaxID=2576452 RepID=A0A4P8PSM6_9VIRU|nr:replication initiator protein [Blackfly microvirus SF02]